ncbi:MULTISPECIES: thioesterase II family protein [unclassified Micromonospora]|uniref:thioesterase II family protein n=1 Tax=unclassified Micromonospora TaxID=2617518 RepID=UPI00098D6824|nr:MULTISPECIES: alpha/beta fold hydrolase [unclassified Micromonospora]MDI5938946.1 alpha/beta fold hydrolase [Micromonospora sp. DH15]OON32458.1 thioesterase [Micromonospora sp. Rc5]
MSGSSSRWLEVAVPNAGAPRRLVCFPHAGGSAVFFRDWGRRLPECEVLAVRYPGRGERIDEPEPTDLVPLARDIAEALVPLADRPMVLFGHSMGAVVALETARAMRAAGVEPAHLIASGSRDVPADEPAFRGAEEEEDDDAILARLVRLGGTDAELAEDPIFQELVLPYIRSDGRMFHAYRMEPTPRLGCPVTTVVGDIDTDADRRPWRELTTGAHREVSVRGNHFYLVNEPPVDVVRSALRAGSAAGR